MRSLDVPVIARALAVMATAVIAMGGVFVGSTAVQAAGLAGSGDTGPTIYVSPRGDDNNPGTYARPLRSLARAQAIVRTQNQNMIADISVYLEGGTYRLSRPLVMGPQDSGTNGFDVVWTSVPGEIAVISGADAVTGWSLKDPSKHIWAARVPAGLRTRQLYVNGVRASLASGTPPVLLTRTSTGYRASSTAMSGWRNPSEIDFVYTGQLGLMDEPICPVASITGTVITMAQPCWNNSNLRVQDLVGYGTLGRPTYIENAYELLDEPGQFYLDSKAHMLYYIPRPGEDMATADVEAPALQSLVEGAGSARSPIHNIAFSNLQFSYATWLQPDSRQGFSEVQSGYSLTGPHGYSTEGLCQYAPHGTCPYGAWTKEPGNVQFSYDKNLSFLDDRFAHLGAAGLNLDDGTQEATVQGSVFTDISGNGIEVGNVDMPLATGASRTSNIVVSDNHLYGLPAEYEGGVAVLVGYAANTTISYNQIDHVPYSGISVGWGGWPDKIFRPPVANFSQNNMISHNLIFDFMQDLGDGGAIYTQGITGTALANGEKVTSNVIHGQMSWGRALQTDNGATYVTLSRNVLYDNTWDWGSDHVDYNRTDRSYDPLVVTKNYWQQNEGNSVAKNVTVLNNQLISGVSQAPASIVDDAGIQPAFRSILGWQPALRSAPSSPGRVSALYAFNRTAYVTWRPPTVVGSGRLTSYTITACEAVGGIVESLCAADKASRVTVPAAKFRRLGYAVFRELAPRQSYSFTVVASNAVGSGVQSPPSSVYSLNGKKPGLPGKPLWVYAEAGRDAVGLTVQLPLEKGCSALFGHSCHQALLSYEVTSSSGQTYHFSGLRRIVSGGAGREVFVIAGLSGGRSYTFSVREVNPSGIGPQLRTAPVIPLV